MKDRSAGIGFIIRDFTGSVVAGTGDKICSSYALMSEAIGLREGGRLFLLWVSVRQFLRWFLPRGYRMIGKLHLF